MDESVKPSREAALDQLRRNFELYCRTVLKIKTKAGRLIPFVWNRAQKHFARYLIRKLVAGEPIRCIILKARQLGFSTLISAFFYWIESMNPYRGALVVCHDLDSVHILFDKYKTFYKCSPEELRPMRKISNRRELYFANPDEAGTLGLESRVLVDTANNPDLGASFTLQLVHLSEFARYERLTDVKIAMISLNQAIPNLPGTAKIIETTAQGAGYFKDMWDEENEYDKFFISWVADDTYSLRGPSDYFELSESEDARYGDEIRESALVRDQLLFWYPEVATKDETGLKWLEGETLSRLRWRRWCIDNNCEKDKIKFRQEYPTCFSDAFAVTGSGVFDQTRLAEIRKGLIDFYGKNKDAISGFSYSTKASAERTHNRTWWNRSFYRSAHGRLRVFEPPRNGFYYVIGADVADGLLFDGDNSAASVLRCPDLKQVAQWAAPIEPDEFADLLYALGMLYNKALMGVEIEGPGRATILRLSKELYYPHLYWREVHDDIEIKRQTKHGWHTTSITKPILISSLQGALRDDEIQLRDMDTVVEMMEYVKRNDGTYGNPPVKGKHDDRVMSLMIALQMAKQVHVPTSKVNSQSHRTLDGITKTLDQSAGRTWRRFGEEPNSRPEGGRKLRRVQIIEE